MNVREVTFELREGTAAEWTAKDPVLRRGEPGFERDTNQLKIGDGNSHWSTLPYLTGGSGGSVTSVFGRLGVITAQSGDYTKAQVGLGSVDNTSDLDKPLSTATISALTSKADAAATTAALATKANDAATTASLALKANLVSGSVPYSELPLLAFRGSWGSGTAYESGDIVMHSESLFGTAAGVAADITPFTVTKLLTGTPSNTDSSDFDEYEFFSYFDVSERVRMTGITFLKVATQTEVPITVRLWDRDISLTAPLLVKTVSPGSSFAGEVVAPLLWDLVPGKNYAVSFSVGFGSGFGYVYTPSFAFPLNVGAVTLRNAGFSNAEGTITSPNLGTLYWAGIQWQAVNAGWTRLANIEPPEGAKGDKGNPGNNGVDGDDGAQGPPGPIGEVYPLTALGFLAASARPEDCHVGSGNGEWMVRVWIPAGVPITKVGAYVTGPGSATTGFNAFAIYDAAGNFVEQTANDTSMWNTGGYNLRNLNSVIAAQSTGRFVYAAIAFNVASDILYNQNNAFQIFNGVASGHRRMWIGASRQGGFPSSVNIATEGVGSGEYPYLPLIVIA